MRLRIVRYLLAICCAFALFATACGSGSSGSVATSDSASEDANSAADSQDDSSDDSSEPSESSDNGESPIADLLGIPISNDDEMEQFFSELSRNAERKISECMLAQGFQYTVVDYSAAGGFGVNIDDSSKEYAEEYGFGIASNPFEEAFESFESFEDPNREYVKTLGDGEREAYETALRGDMTEFDSEEDFATFQPSGCSGEAYEEVFSFGLVFEQFGDEFEEVGEQFDADPRIVAAKSGWGDCMREAGYAYSEAQDAQDDVRRRYTAIVDDPDAFEEVDGAEVEGDRIEVEGPGTSEVFFGPGTLKPAYQQRVDELAVEERAIALASWECDSPLREIEEDIQFEYEQKFVDQYGSAISDALGE